MDFQSHVKEKLKVVLAKYVNDPSQLEIFFEHPQMAEHGDYSTNLAMELFPTTKGGVQGNRQYWLGVRKANNPRELAQNIADDYTALGDGVIEKVEVAGPGFINFFLNTDTLLNGLKRFEIDSNSQIEDNLKGKKIAVEFTDPNPFKEFHIGHLFTNTVGETLTRLFASQGAIVKRINYQGDVGMHVAKAIWGMKKSLEEDGLTLSELEKQSLVERTAFLGRAYALGAVAFEENAEAKNEITELNTKIYQKDKEIEELYAKGKAWSLEAFEQIYKRLGTKFDFNYFESDTAEVGKKYVREHMKDGIFEESEGAVIFRGEKYGLHTRVFINSQGLPTYEAKDLGLAETKHKDFAYDESFIVTGNDIKDYFKVVIKVLSIISPDLGNKTHHVTHGMVRLSSGKMSSRKGNVIKGESLLDEAKAKLLGSFPTMESVVADKVAVGAIKWSLLSSALGSDITFDFGKSLSFEGNSGPYIQYTFARTQSVLAKANNANFNFTAENLNPEELALLKYYYQYQEIVALAAKSYSPNLLTNYLFELAQKFNHFYNTNRIIEAESGKKDLRLALTKTVGVILQSGLYLLGIEAPERM